MHLRMYFRIKILQMAGNALHDKWKCKLELERIYYHKLFLRKCCSAIFSNISPHINQAYIDIYNILGQNNA